jgi:hypothetical protein
MQPSIPSPVEDVQPGVQIPGEADRIELGPFL